VRAMLRRPRSVTGAPHDPGSAPEVEPLTVGALLVDTVAHRATLDDTVIDLTRTEFDLLATLAARPRAAFTRRQLIDAVWGPEWYGDEHVVDVHVGHLRRKLGDDAANPLYIRTVRGVGYGMASQ